MSLHSNFTQGMMFRCSSALECHPHLLFLFHKSLERGRSFLGLIALSVGRWCLKCFVSPWSLFQWNRLLFAAWWQKYRKSVHWIFDVFFGSIREIKIVGYKRYFLKFDFADSNWRQAEAWIVLPAGAVEVNALAHGALRRVTLWRVERTPNLLIERRTLHH